MYVDKTLAKFMHSICKVYAKYMQSTCKVYICIYLTVTFDVTFDVWKIEEVPTTASTGNSFDIHVTIHFVKHCFSQNQLITL